MGEGEKARGRVAYLFGSDLQTGVVAAGTGSVASPGSTDVWNLREGDRGDFARIHIPGNFRRIKTRPSLAGIRIILNLITDPDLNPDVLHYADQFLKPFRGKILNRPQAVLKSGRDHVARLLDGIDGLIVPRVVRFRGHPNLAAGAVDKAGIRFPAILRETGKHDGDVIGVITDRDELLARVDPAKHYFLTEFVELRSDSGLYHKIRVYFFGQRSLVRHRLVSDHWNVHAPDRPRVLVHHPGAIAREQELIERGIDALPPVARAAILAIRARMPLDYFGIDFAVMPDDRVLLFEANATMKFFPIAFDPPFPYFATTLAQATRAFNAMLADED
ncbi:hypothetical protein ASE00_21620 [Sphingomonas sp. Root710]|uniref:hypothetical protein n=1 Tax=Sphingomonas sp. Root710 TaxID=1736594 RepID=UPI0006FD31A3|nr:hypothetical protein [Sphingomonas sp. Root710]KRB85081.1 hypothetical protein ASE00_21620 [Sphingomonas sp. Root710]